MTVSHIEAEIASTESEIQGLEARLDILRNDLHEAIPRQKLKCKCGKYTTVSEIDVIQTLRDGESEGYHFVCECQWPNKNDARLRVLVEHQAWAFKSLRVEYVGQ